jgi:undecaprenyl-diphosphatase UppP
LELTKAIFGENAVGKESMLMTVVLHFATALSTVVIFWKEIAQIIKGLFAFKWNDELKFSLKIILSMIPAAIVGVVFKDEIESLFGGAIMLVGVMLILTGILLFLADRAKKTDRPVGFGHSIIVGISQAIAILPGISRSGATISTSVLLGIDREKAAKFSFLMVVPLIFGAILFDTKDYLENRALENTVENERTLTIVGELEKDDLFTAVESKLAFGAVFEKELKWSEAKLAGETSTKTIEEVYRNDLHEAGIPSDRIDQILSHDYGMVRPLQGPNFMALMVGFIAAFITGLFACRWMIALVKKAQLKYFSFYCFAVGIIAISYTLING